MVLTKDEIKNVFNRNADELQQKIDLQRTLVASLLGNEVDIRNLSLIGDMVPLSTREKILKKAVAETINVLEDTRKSFKSKKLEELRKKLTDVLCQC